MARRWLLSTIAGIGLTFGLATGASAQVLPDDGLTADLGVASATVTADTAERALTVETETDVAVPEAETVVAPSAEVVVAPEPSVDVQGPVEAGGSELPIPQVVAPVEEAVGPGPAPADAVPAPSPRGGTQAAGDAVAPAAAPQPAGQPAARTSDEPRRSPAMSADRAAARAGLRAVQTTVVADEGVLAPIVAPDEEALPLVAAAAPTSPVVTDLALPVIDTTPTVPGLLRLLAGLLVVGAAATWRTVREELA